MNLLNLFKGLTERLRNYLNAYPKVCVRLGTHRLRRADLAKDAVDSTGFAIHACTPEAMRTQNLPFRDFDRRSQPKTQL